MVRVAGAAASRSAAERAGPSAGAGRVLLVREHVRGHGHPVGEVVHRRHLGDVPCLLQREAGVEEGGEVVAVDVARREGQLLGVGGDRCPSRVEAGAPPVEGDPLPSTGSPSSSRSDAPCAAARGGPAAVRARRRRRSARGRRRPGAPSARGAPSEDAGANRRAVGRDAYARKTLGMKPIRSRAFAKSLRRSSGSSRSSGTGNQEPAVSRAALGDVVMARS